MQKAHRFTVGFLFKLIGRRPTLPRTRARSTIGAERLNFRVRNGNGWNPLATITQSHCHGGPCRAGLALRRAREGLLSQTLPLWLKRVALATEYLTSGYNLLE